MDELLSPLAKLDLDGYSSDSNSKSSARYDIFDDINGNIEDPDAFLDCQLDNKKLQSSLENLVNNFDSIVAECFNDNDEKLDSFSPLSESYQNNHHLLDKNQIWLSLTQSLEKPLNLDWRTFKTYEEFKNAVNLHREDVVNQNLDLPDDEELANALDHHSRPTGTLPCDFEPLQTADEIISEIDDILGTKPTNQIEYFVSSLHQSDFIGSQEAIDAGRSLLHQPPDWLQQLEKKSIRELNILIERLEDAIRDFSSILVEELAERNILEDEKEDRDLFVNQVHQVEKIFNQNLQSPTSSSTTPTHESAKSTKLINKFLLNNETNNVVKRANSWKSIFLGPLQSNKSKNNNNNNNNTVMSNSFDDIMVNNKPATVEPISIPVHTGFCEDRECLSKLNELLHALLHTPKQFNQLLTDYILNVYAPSDLHNQPPLLDLII